MTCIRFWLGLCLVGLNTVLMGCGTAHSLSDLGAHQIVNYDGLAGIYRVDSEGHFPSGSGASISTKRGDLEVGDTVAIATHQDVNGGTTTSAACTRLIRISKRSGRLCCTAVVEAS